MDSKTICFALILASCTFTDGFVFSGLNSFLEKSTTLQGKGWHSVPNWNEKKVYNKPGTFIQDVQLSDNKATFTINKPGIYYVSYNLRLSAISGAKYRAAVVIDNDVTNGQSMTCRAEASGESFDVSGNGFIKLTEFNKISIMLEVIHTGNITTTVTTDSSISFSLITTAGVIPSFSFSMQTDVTVKPRLLTGLDNWSEEQSGEFHTSVGFVTGRPFIQVIFEGIYLVSANLILETKMQKASLRVQIKINDMILRQIHETLGNTTVKTININQVMYLKKADSISLQLKTEDNDIEVKRQSSWSASLINQISKHTIGFHSIMRSSAIVNTINSYHSIPNWPTAFDSKTEFKSPTVFTNLVNNNRDFNPSNRGIFIATANIILSCTSLIGKQVTISIYSQAASFSITSRIITGSNRVGCSNTKTSVTVSLSSALDLLKIQSISVSVKTNVSSVTILPGSNFAVCQLMIFYPGMLGRLTATASYSTVGWQTLRGWKTNEIKGGYDFLSSLNATTGQYRVPIDGIYLVSTNIVVNDLSQVEALVSTGGKIDIANGMYIKIGNPTPVMTLNIAGIIELQRNDELSVMLNSPSDTDWSVKENSGFSIAYVGRNSHCFRAYLPVSIKVSSNGWIGTSNWHAQLVYGSAFTPASGKFKIPVSGVYYTTASLILENADSEVQNSYFQMAIKVNGEVVNSLKAHRSGPKRTPSRRRYYPLFISGSYRAARGDIVTLDVYSNYVTSYSILDNSGWSMLLVADDSNTDQVGFNVPRSGIKNFFAAYGGQWYTINSWQPYIQAKGAFYTSSKLNFDDGAQATIRSTGFYAISANIKLFCENSQSAFSLALFIEDELQQNGLMYENQREWTTFTMHFSGVAFLTEDQTVKLKISSAANFIGSAIKVDSGFSIVKLQLAEPFPGASVIVKESHNIPIATGLPVNAWTVQNRAASFSFTSGRRYNKTSGIFRVRDVGYYLVSMNLIVQSNSSNQENITVTMHAGNSSEKFVLQTSNRSTETISSTRLLSQQVSDTIFVSTSIIAKGNNTYQPWPASNISLQGGSSFSVIKFPQISSTSISYAVYHDSVFYSSPGLQQLTRWSIPPSAIKSEAAFTSRKDGIFFINMNIKMTHFIGTVSFYFTSNQGELAASSLTCKTHCQEYTSVSNFVRLQQGDVVSVFMLLGRDSHLTLAATSHRSINYVRPYTAAVGVSIRANTSPLVKKTGKLWKAIENTHFIRNSSSGAFDARGNYSTMSSMIIPKTGAYQVVVNFILEFPASNQGQGTVEIGVSKNGMMSESSALYSKRVFDAEQNFTVHIISSVIIQKWTKIGLMIRASDDIVIHEGTTVSVVFVDSIIHEVYKDEGPRMGDPLSPAFISTAIANVKRQWTCTAFGNENPKYRWYKNGQVYDNTNILRLDGRLSDSGTYYCEANITGILAETNTIDIKIYDVDECYYGNHSCHAQATCTNNKGSYDCTCNAGYTGNGTDCQDVNECSLGLHDCATYANCTNLPGTFSCYCPKGFFGDGKVKCNDLNECLASIWNDCNENAICSNLIGSYICKCSDGWTGDGENCTDLNECLTLPSTTPQQPITTSHPNATQGPKILYCHTDAVCVNYQGYYGCQCKVGYTGNGTHCYATSSFGNNPSSDPCVLDKTSLKCICKDSKQRDKNILCNGLFVAIIILSVVAIVVIMFGVKYIKSRKNIKIGPVKAAKDKYIEMEDESEV
eukprot:gene3190-3661_t